MTRLGHRFHVQKVSKHFCTGIASEEIKAGELVGLTTGKLTTQPSRFSIQISENLYVDFCGGLRYIRHGAHPNTRLVVSNTSLEVACVALRDIAKGEELRWDLSTTDCAVEADIERELAFLHEAVRSV